MIQWINNYDYGYYDLFSQWKKKQKKKNAFDETHVWVDAHCLARRAHKVSAPWTLEMEKEQ